MQELVRSCAPHAPSLTTTVDLERCLAVALPVINDGRHPLLHLWIRFLGRVIPHFPPDRLLELVPTLLPGVLQGFRHSSADVRKAVVFCLVDIFMVLGDRLTPFLNGLSTSQLKLVTIYVKRMMDVRTQQGRPTPSITLTALTGSAAPGESAVGGPAAGGPPDAGTGAP